MTPTNAETVSLITRLAQGEPGAVSECLRTHGDLLWALAGRVAPGPDAREEAVAEALTAIWREATNYRDSHLPEREILVLIARRRLTAWRRDLGDEGGSGEADSDIAFDGLDDPIDERGRVAARTLADLPSHKRRVAVLVFGHGLPPEGVARLTGTDETQTLADAREALAALHRALVGDDSADAPDSRQRLLTLLTDAAARPLDDAERQEVESLLADDSAIDEDAMERCAAALVLALGEGEAMPEAVGQRLIDRWRRRPGVTTPRAEGDRRAEASAGPDRTRLAAYWLAGAGMVLAVLGWWPTLSQQFASPAGPQERIRTLLAEDADAVQIEWQPGDAAADDAVSGQVVWSNDRQQGYMVLDNVRPNDPDRRQYQLWIVDNGREGPPVSGGLFNVPDDGPRQIVPIDPELPVREPSLFAVTREDAGGVVVSDQEDVVLTAKPERSADD